VSRLVVPEPQSAPAHFLRGHPERPERVDAAAAGIDDLHLGDDRVVIDARDATIEELARVHDAAYLHALQEFGGGRLDQDTYATVASWSAARLAAGTMLAAVEALEAGRGDVAFVAVRPPGHHAGRGRPMGFCLINNVAVAAGALINRGERVLIVDWDVHHGNGTQDIFWNDPRVLYVSTHQAPFYPGTGAVTETGGESAPGLTVNIPLPAGATGDVLQRAFEEVVAPAADHFGPTWVLVSAGFDAHRDDPLADLSLSSGDFARLATLVAGLVPPGRLAFILEGGYDLHALRTCTAATVAAALGLTHASENMTAGGPGIDAVERARHVHNDQ
jgi:acetoin utilization deacetylase AcuC-like enzyme